jgi:hypothetical protein
MIYYSCIREQITAVSHFLMESRTNVTVSDLGVALPDQVVVLFHSQPSQLFPSASTTPQFHSPSQGSYAGSNSCLMITVCVALV